jgi:hypothetical protein
MERPADSAVGDVPEKPIEDYPEDKQGGKAAKLTFGYPTQKYRNSVTCHSPAVYTVGGSLA